MINNLLEYAKSINLDLEVYAIKNNEVTIEYLNTELINYKIQDIKEYKLKAIIDGATVTTNVLDISDPTKVIEILKMARTLTDELDKDSLALEIDIDNNLRKSDEIDLNFIKENLKKLNSELKNKYPSIFTINSEFNFEKDEYEICNTNGVTLKDYNYHGFYMSDVVLKIDGENLSCYTYIMGKELIFDEFKQKIEKKIEETINKYNFNSVKTDKYNVVINNKCVFDLIDAFMPDFHAKTINQKQSVFNDKLGKKIFNEKITIVEDPTNSELIGTRLFDSEGIKTYYKEIVKNGEFITKLYNKKFAEKDNVKSTGNSHGVTNMYILPGDKNEEELIKIAKDGVYIDCLMGLHNGINHLTGDISIQCEGFLIKNGQKTKGIKQIILTTNIFELLTNVKEIGNNLEFFSSRGGDPSLLIENITITGKEV